MEFQNVINATMVLLILSLITEKIANFIKLRRVNLAIPQNSLFFEINRTRAIQQRSVVIGIIVAILCKADLFVLFSSTQPFFWTLNDFRPGDSFWGWLLTILTTVFGCLITGFFLSFGSKFFHDLLDLLLETKNLKRKLADRNNWDFDTIAEIDQYIETNEATELKATIKNSLAGFNNVAYYKIDYNQRLIHLFCKPASDPSLSLRPDNLPPIDGFRLIIMDDKVSAVKALALIKPAMELANAAPFKGLMLGTSGAVLQNNDSDEKFLLTCYHAVWNGPPMKWSGFGNDFPCAIQSPLKNGQQIGNLYIGIKNYRFDIALVRPTPDSSFSNLLPDGRKPRGTRTLTRTDTRKGTRLMICPRDSSAQYNYGVCAEVDVTAKIIYPDASEKTLEELILIKPIGDKPFSRRGDSGSIVLDEFGYAVGLLVAGDEQNASFAISLEPILESYNLKLLL